MDTGLNDRNHLKDIVLLISMVLIMAYMSLRGQEIVLISRMGTKYTKKLLFTILKMDYGIKYPSNLSLFQGQVLK